MAISNARNGYINGTTSGWVARSLFAVGNDWYAVVLNTSAVLIEVHKSTDGGVTWTEMDSGDSLSHSGATHSYDANMPLSGSSTDFIYVAYRTATNTVRVRRFDTSTDTWESTDIGSANATTTAHSDFGIGIGVRSDDDVLLAYRHSSDTFVYSTVYEGSSWASPTDVDAANSFPLILQSLLMTGNSDIAILSLYNENQDDHECVSIDNANALGTYTNIDTTGTATIQYSGFSAYAMDGSDHMVGAATPDSSGELDFIRINTASTSFTAPAWSVTSNLTPTSTTDAGSMGYSVVAFQGRWHVVWSGDGRGSIHHDLSDDLTTPAFGTDRDVVTGLANNPAVYAAASAYGVGVLYTDHTTPSVDFAWAWGAQPTAITWRTPTIDVTSVAATSHGPTIPTGLANGDVVYIWLACNGGSISSGPSGFTEIANENTQANPKYSVWRKVITNAAGEAAWAFTTTSITKTSICVAFIGVDNTTPEDVAENTGTNSTGSNASLVAGVTTATDDALLVWSVALNSSTADIYEPPIMAKFGETTGTKRQMVTYEPRPTAGATGSRTGGSSSAALPWAAIMFAIRPASVGGPVTISAPVSTATATAPTPTIKDTLSAPASTATALANAPGIGVTINAPTATATATAPAPTLILPIIIAAPVSTASASANAPTVLLSIATPTGTATANAPNPSLLSSISAPASTASALAPAPTLSVVVNAPTSTATALALDPTITTSSGAVTVSAPVSTATALANAPAISILVSAPVSTASAAANAPTLAVTITAPTATATAQAHVPDLIADVVIAAPVSTASAQALAPTLAVTIAAPASTASAEAIAPVILTANPVLILAPVATATALALVPDVGILYDGPAYATTDTVAALYATTDTIAALTASTDVLIALYATTDTVAALESTTDTLPALYAIAEMISMETP